MAQDENNTELNSPVTVDQRSLVPYQSIPDEIDLVDLGVSLWRRRWVFCVCFVLVFGLGVAYAFIHNPSYEYRALMRVGTLHALGGQQVGSVVSSQQLASSISQVYVPVVESQLIHSGMKGATHLKVGVDVPKSAQVVSVSVEAPSRYGPTVRKLLTRVVAMAQAGVNRKISQYETREASYLKEEIQRIESKVKAMEAQTRSLSHQAGGSAAASFVAGSVARLMAQEAKYRHRLEVTLPSNSESSGMIGSVVRSNKPKTMGRGTILVFAFVVAVFLALVASALVGYGFRVRDRLRSY